MLFGEDFGGCHEGYLLFVGYGIEGGDRGDESFPASNISLEESIHGTWFGHVLENFPGRFALGVGQVVGEGVEELFDEVGLCRKAVCSLGLKGYALLKKIDVYSEKLVKIPSFESNSNVIFVLWKMDFLEHFLYPDKVMSLKDILRDKVWNFFEV